MIRGKRLQKLIIKDETNGLIKIIFINNKIMGSKYVR